MDVNFQLGRSLHSFYNEHGKPYLLLDDGLRLEYDTVLCATGQSEVLRNIPGNFSIQDSTVKTYICFAIFKTIII